MTPEAILAVYSIHIKKKGKTAGSHVQQRTKKNNK
jgi:hypothetical protein